MCPCVRCESMWQFAKALSTHSLWMTVWFYELHPYVGFLRSYNCFLMYIASRSPGKAADMSAWESFYGGASKGQNTRQVKHPIQPLGVGLERGKARPCRREQRNIKGAFSGWEEIKSHLKNKSNLGRRGESRLSVRNKGALLGCGINLKKKATVFWRGWREEKDCDLVGA